MRKDVPMKRHKCTNSEREYVRGLVHNLSFQRWTDQEIANYLNDEKKIEISRSRVSRIKNQVERNAEKWYIELRQSRYKYIAMYKERIDSLFSYQRKLNQIIDAYLRPGDIIYTDTIIRAIAELHRIEMSIFGLWKQLPALDIVDANKETEDSSFSEGYQYQYDNVGPSGLPRAISHGPEEDEREDRAVFFGWKQGDPPLDNNFRAMMEEKYGLSNEPWDDPKWIQCPSCNRWFKSMVRLEMHAGRYCIPEPTA